MRISSSSCLNVSRTMRELSLDSIGRISTSLGQSDLINRRTLEVTPTQLRSWREKNRLTAADLGRGLMMGGRNPGESIRDYEAGTTKIPGPVETALLMHDEAREAWNWVEELATLLAKHAPSDLHLAYMLEVERGVSTKMDKHEVARSLRFTGIVEEALGLKFAQDGDDAEPSGDITPTDDSSK